MQYDSQEQKNLVMNALTAFSVPLGQRNTVDPLVTQLAQGKVVPPVVEKPAGPKPHPITGPRRKGKKKK